MSMTTPTGGANYNAGPGAGLITAVTPAPGSQARIPFAGGLARLPETKQTTETSLVQTYRRMSPALRQALSQQLKDAGYGNPVTSEFNLRVREAFLNANRDLNDEIQFRFQSDPSFFDNNKYDLSTFLKERTNAGAGTGGEKITTVRTRQELRPEAIEATINEVYRDVLGRGATQEEVAKYSERIQKQMGKKKNMAQVTYENVGGGVQERTERQAFSPQTYLYQEIAGTDEAKQRSVFGFYDAFKRALGVG